MTKDSQSPRRRRRSRRGGRPTNQQDSLQDERAPQEPRAEAPLEESAGPERSAPPSGGGKRDEFKTFGLDAQVLRGIQELGFTEARPIQRKAIPAVLEGKDVLGLAQTGTGKTAAFALPILEHLRAGGGQRRGPRALVIAPTRELALQIHEEFSSLGKFTRVRSTTVFGGVPQNAQVRALKSRPEVVVACPGRLLDLAGQRVIDLRDVEVLVLDEADHMFDMGFLPNVRQILRLLPERRQNLLFSATMPKEIRHLADEVLHRPAVIELAHSRPADTIEHALYECAQPRRLDLLEEILGGPDFRSAIVFLRTKHRARKIARQLDAHGHRAIALQGNMSQNQRVRAMEGFRRGDYDVLVATDIAARGIDVADVSHVVNFDVPNTPEAYTHRIGRTGRSKKQGKAFTFFAREDGDQVRAIERHLGSKIPRKALEGFDPGDVNALPKPAPSRGGGGRGGRGPRGGGSGGGGGGGGARRRGGGRGRGSSAPKAFPRPASRTSSGGSSSSSSRRSSSGGGGFGRGL
jgi:ATP-dependent RNA helicase RhlE